MKPVTLALLALALFALAGCGPSFRVEVAAPAVYSIDPEAAAYGEDLTLALAHWDAALGRRSALRWLVPGETPVGVRVTALPEARMVAPQYVAYAERSSATITINRDRLVPGRGAAVLVHEIGHLILADESHLDRGIMCPGVSRSAPACVDVTLAAAAGGVPTCTAEQELALGDECIAPE